MACVASFLLDNVDKRCTIFEILSTSLYNGTVRSLELVLLHNALGVGITHWAAADESTNSQPRDYINLQRLYRRVAPLDPMYSDVSPSPRNVTVDVSNPN